jgi:hypothetical protein
VVLDSAQRFLFLESVPGIRVLPFYWGVGACLDGWVGVGLTVVKVVKALGVVQGARNLLTSFVTYGSRIEEAIVCPGFQP